MMDEEILSENYATDWQKEGGEMCEIVFKKGVAIDQYMLAFLQNKMRSVEETFAKKSKVVAVFSRDEDGLYKVLISSRTSNFRLDSVASDSNYLKAFNTALLDIYSQSVAGQVAHGFDKGFSVNGFGNKIIKTAV